MTVSPPGLTDPPPSASKWLDLFQSGVKLIGQIVKDNLVPFVLLGLALWYMVEQQKRSDNFLNAMQKRWDAQAEATQKRWDDQTVWMRADLKDARAETSKAFDRCVAAGDKQATSVKEAVRNVGEVIKAAQPTPAPAPAP